MATPVHEAPSWGQQTDLNSRTRLSHWLRTPVICHGSANVVSVILWQSIVDGDR